jgi:hypothetical protein
MCQAGHRALGKQEADIAVALEELEQRGVCSFPAEGVIEIRERFWPYQRNCASMASAESQRYVAEVKRLFLERHCVQSSFTVADEKLALSQFGRGVPLVQIERAILLGTLRKYVSALQNARGTPISSLYYFINLFEEVPIFSSIPCFLAGSGRRRHRTSTRPDHHSLLGSCRDGFATFATQRGLLAAPFRVELVGVGGHPLHIHFDPIQKILGESLIQKRLM